jgi:hypothetical protein
MKEDNKYYTPAIEEFHVGFEYEWKDVHTGIWHTHIAEETDFGTNDMDGSHESEYVFNQNFHSEDVIRVKCFDKEDIESLNIPAYIKIKHILGHVYEITATNGRIFRGNIKNKSELKVLLKQLDI